jgi:GDPmannose 4,6-dehydratase
MKKKIALIFGITGQDGSYLAELLLKKKYIVHGVKRRSSIINTSRIDNLYYNKKNRFFLHYGDLLDTSNIFQLIKKINPDEIYNLAAQSHVKVSFELPIYTSDVNALGCLRILEFLRIYDKNKKIKFYQASSSEMFGNSNSRVLNEKSYFNPQSSYGIAKLFAHHVTKNYREAYNIFASSGILFNHESFRRGETFVTKKIINGLCKIKTGRNEKLILGNLYSKRDWGHAKDYAEAMWKMLQQKKPDDYVIATGKQYTIKQFINHACKILSIKIKWVGKGLKEKCINLENNRTIIECNKKYLRPTEVNNLLGNAKKAKIKLNWKPKYNLNSLIIDMIDEELRFLDGKKT